MAKNNPGDILTSDWNPVVGCQRYSIGCRKCWLLGGAKNRGIIEWQQGLGNIPKDLPANQPYVMEKRLNAQSLRSKNGIIGVVQHSDLFWDKTSDDTIHRILNVVDEVAAIKAAKNNPTKYVLWTKRAERMANFINARHPQGVPRYLACGISVENQEIANDRIPHLVKVKGWRFVMIEPMVGPIDLSPWIKDVNWVVVGSETGGDDAAPLDLNWLRPLRNLSVAHGVPFFIKQTGNNHKKPARELDGRTWDQFPDGFAK
jgi:protein gp37